MEIFKSRLQNIVRTSYPYAYLRNATDNESCRLDEVIFFGTDYQNLPAPVNRAAFIDATNRCLDAIRRWHPGATLLYRPHPVETEREWGSLNLHGFQISRDSMMGEMFLLKHIERIRAVYSMCSGVCISAFNLGIDTHVFTPLLEGVFDASTAEGYREYFVALPSGFFIDNLINFPSRSAGTLARDEALEETLKQLTVNRHGVAWFIAISPNSLTSVLGVARLLRRIRPEMRLILAVVRHRRWDRVAYEDFSKDFDEVQIFPRLLYPMSLRGILKAVRTALRVRKLPIARDDVVLGFSHYDFVENCFISYHRKAARAEFIDMNFYDFNYERSLPSGSDWSDFRRTFSNKVYAFIIEPLLGLYRTVFMYYRDGKMMNRTRYEAPLEEVFDRVVVFHST